MPGPRTQAILDALRKEHPDFGPVKYEKMLDEIEGEFIGGALDGLRIGPRYFDREGQPITMRDWMYLWREDIDGFDYRRVAYTETNLFYVSTVWLGLDHGFSFRGGAPIIFESMTFAQEVSRRKATEGFTTESGTYFPPMPEYFFNQDYDQRRYATEEQAVRGHAEMVEECWAMEKMMSAVDPRKEGI